MQRPFMIPGKLNEILKCEQNIYMSKKLNEANPFVNIKCPESFEFYKSIFKKNKKFISKCN